MRVPDVHFVLFLSPFHSVIGIRSSPDVSPPQRCGIKCFELIYQLNSMPCPRNCLPFNLNNRSIQSILHSTHPHFPSSYTLAFFFERLPLAPGPCRRVFGREARPPSTTVQTILLSPHPPVHEPSGGSLLASVTECSDSNVVATLCCEGPCAQLTSALRYIHSQGVQAPQIQQIFN